MLAPLSSNPDLPPSVGKSLLTKWKEYGIHQFKHLFTESSLKSFLDLRSEFGIPKQEFYKYLQIRNLITTMKRAGQLSLGLSRMEKILESSTSLKGRVFLIYSALLEHHSSSLTPLKTVWQKELGCDLSDDQWDVMCQNVFTSLSCNKIIEQNYKLRHRMYLTPLRLSKIHPNYRVNHPCFLGMQKTNTFGKGYMISLFRSWRFRWSFRQYSISLVQNWTGR